MEPDDVREMLSLLRRIAASLENMDGLYDDGGGVVAVLNSDNIKDVLREVDFGGGGSSGVVPG